MNMVLKILFNIVVSLATEPLIRALLAAGLEQVKNHTDNKIDDAILEPVINALRNKAP